MKRAFLAILILTLTVALQPGAGASGSSGATVDPLLSSFFATNAPNATMAVVITYDRMPASTELSRLEAVGITTGYALQRLPMVITDMKAAQLQAVRTQPGVLSVWSNEMMTDMTNASRPFIGVNKMAADREISTRNPSNPGFPISGKGVGIGYVDTGIDGTHRDLEYGRDKKTVQNVVQPISEGVVSLSPIGVGVGVNISDTINGTGFVPPTYLEGQPISDLESGHGTHGAAVAAGLGTMSSGFYGGVARGAHLVGVNTGNDFGLPLVAILGAYDYILIHQFDYNIRIINNSWGSGYTAAGADVNNPINVATRLSHDSNMVVIFAAGNAYDTPTSINPYSTKPWTFSVAAGEKQGFGTPADFSSRGIDNGGNPDFTTYQADPNAPPNLRPDVTGSGVDIKSARSKGPGLTNYAGTVPVFVGANDLETIPPAFLPFYTTSRGTSFACPQVSGVVALMLEANPNLKPAEVFTILRQTATPMPYEERVVGAGYVDAHNAVRVAMGLPMVAHPANLFPPPVPEPTGPEIVDPAGDQTGTGAQDILSVDYAYDAANSQIVYTLTAADMSGRTTNMSWTINSNFKNPSTNVDTTIYVIAAIGEQNEVVGQYGKIELTQAGTRQQTKIGVPDSVQFNGNQLVIRLSVSKLSATNALGYNVVGMTSTLTEAIAQIRVGTTLTPSLLVAADISEGRNFKVE